MSCRAEKRRPARSRAGPALVALLLAGCATPQTEQLLREPPPGIAPERALDVTFYPQDRGHCGPAVLAMALTQAGDPATPTELADWAYTPGASGSFQHDMLTAVQRRGRLALPVADVAHALAEVDAGHPVVVLQNLSLQIWPRWHYALLVGYDLRRGDAILHTGTRRSRRISLGLLERTWGRADDWGFVVVEPGELPARPEASTYLEASAGLEQAGRYAEAAAAYRAATLRWPENGVAWLGLGNTRYAEGDLVRAERAFRRAVRVDPGAGVAWNNLAQVLLETGHRQEARSAVDRALALGGPFASTYERTAKEVDSAR
jgi:tetratricopeptide (TPR) repeat protein